MFRELLRLWSQQDLLQQSLDTVAEMLEQTRLMYVEALAYVLEGQELHFNVRKRDKQLNGMVKQVRRNILEHLSVNAYMDTVPGLVLVSVVGDVERIGDYTKNLLDLREFRPADGKLPAGFDDLFEISRALPEYFILAREAFVTGEGEVADKVIAHHQQARKICDQVVERVLADQSTGKSDAVFLVLFSRYVKRSSAHLKNVATSVVKPFDEIGFSKPVKIKKSNH